MSYLQIPVRGYAALISTLIVCTVLTVLTFQVGTSMYLARLSVLESAHAAIAHAHAYSCAQIALFELSADWSYHPGEGGQTIKLSQNMSCEIESIVSSNAQRTITVHGSHEGFHTTLEVTLEEKPISSPPFTILSFREI